MTESEILRKKIADTIQQLELIGKKLQALKSSPGHQEQMQMDSAVKVELRGPDGALKIQREGEG